MEMAVVNEVSPSKDSFHKKGFISLCVFGSFLIMSLTGIILYFTPKGRIAYWVDWRFLGLTKSDWGDIHIISCFLFVVMGSYHLCYNWEPFTLYLSSKIGDTLRLKKELSFSITIMIFVIFGSLYKVPPLNFVLDFGEYLKSSWTSEDFEPPISHAEQLSLETFAKKMNIDLSLAFKELREKGIRLDDRAESLENIAKRNRTSPMKLYGMIKKYERAERDANEGRYTPQRVEEKFAGTGIGRKSLAEICAQTGVDVAQAKERLARNQIIMRHGETLKEAAAKYNLTPIEILKVILMDHYKLN
jgi:hypothetical protein